MARGRNKSVMRAAALALLAMCSGFAWAGNEEIAHGHIALAGPWTTMRSISVATDADAPDGFFFPAPATGTRLRAFVTRNGTGLPYYLSLNFHGPNRGTLGRNYLGGCTGELLDANLGLHTSADVECDVPAGATTGEVTSFSGADLDVTVTIVRPAVTSTTKHGVTREKSRVLGRTTQRLPNTGTGVDLLGAAMLAGACALTRLRHMLPR